MAWWDDDEEYGGGYGADYEPPPGEYGGGVDYEPGWTGYEQPPSGGGGVAPTEVLPYGNRPVYPATTGESAWAREIREKNAATSAWGRKLGQEPRRPSFIPSKQGRIPGEAWGAGGPTGSYMTPPAMGPMPTFNLPVRDEARIGSLAQKAAGPGLRELRKGMREAQGRYYENPNVRRMTLRDAMAGYGMGLEKVMGGARREARAEYEGEYAGQMTKAQLEYQGQAQQVMSQYQNAWREYLARMTTG